MKRILLPLVVFLFQFSLAGAQSKSSWQSLSTTARDSVFEYAKFYKEFLNRAKTELTSTKEILSRASKAGYSLYKDKTDVKPGAKLIFNNCNRAIILVQIGTGNLLDGCKMIGTHQDSPRIDLKAKPFSESSNLLLFNSSYYGSIKKYQWSNVPLQLTGKVDLESGKSISIEIGNDSNDPVFVIPDAPPHSDQALRGRNYTNVLEGEELDAIAGSIPNENGSIQKEILTWLQTKYGISEQDFVSAELSLVPALEPRDVGLDNSMIGGYGQDDKLCTFVAIESLLSQTKTPLVTQMVYVTDNEETGSINNTGAQSTFLRDVVAFLLEGRGLGSENDVRRTLHKSVVISADVNDCINPIFTSLSDASNSSKIGNGPSIKLYGRSFNANSELIAKFRSLFNSISIPWQTASYKVDGGGGNTIGSFMSKEKLNVIDIGVPVLSMHSPFEISSKLDVWYLRKAFDAFWKSASIME